jgi:2'-5' RNA ligase
MGEYSDSAMIALLPTTSSWSTLKLPHLTLAYIGKIKDLPVTMHNEALKTAYMISLLHPKLTLDVVEQTVFGPPEERVDVFRLDLTDELMAIRQDVEAWDKRTYAYNPHSTIGPEGSFKGKIPSSITFDRILVAWGDDNQSFKLSGESFG